MKKISILFLLITTGIFSQTTNEIFSQNVSGELKDLAIKNMTAVQPATPEAAGLGKFGNLPVNQSFGALQYSIPLYEVKIKGYSLPVYLTYGYTGFRIQDDAGITGLGWTLHAGGLISREKKGFAPDEVGNYYTEIGPAIASGNINNNVVKASFISDEPPGNGGDAEPDIFNINAEGLSGQYVHNENRTPVFITNINNYHIEDFISTNSNDNSIHITDDKGNKYLFDQLVYTIEPGNIPVQPTFGVTYVNNYPTEWWLSEITPVNSTDKIFFDYYNKINGDDIYMLKKSFSKIKIEKEILDHIQCDNNSLSQTFPPDVYFEEKTYYIQRKLLKHIDFPEGRVVFTILDAGNPSHNYYLSEIEIFRKYPDGSVAVNPMLTYTFEYNDINSKYKLLTRIRKFDKYNQEEPFYHFEYNPIPADISDAWENYVYHADAYGYYKNLSPNQDNDLEPDFDSTKKGALTKIYYPTGGFTEINYEQNDTFDKILECREAYVTSNNPDIFLEIDTADRSVILKNDMTGEQITISDLNYAGVDDLSELLTAMRLGNDSNNNTVPQLFVSIGDKITIEKDDELDSSPVITIRDTLEFSVDKILKFHLSTKITSYSSSDTEVQASAKISFSDYVECICNDCMNSIEIDHNFDPYSTTIASDECPPDSNYDYEKEYCHYNIYRIPAHTKIYCEVKTEHLELDNFSRYAFAKIDISEATEIPRIVNKPLGGIRVAGTVDCPDDTANNCIEHHYNYKDEEGKSTGHYIETEEYYKHSASIVKTMPHCQYGAPLGATIDYINHITTFTVPVPSVISGGNIAYYERVEEILNDGSNGKTVNYFIPLTNENNTTDNYYFTTTYDYTEKMEKYPKIKEKIGKQIKKEIVDNFGTNQLTEETSYSLTEPFTANDTNFRSYGAHREEISLVTDGSGTIIDMLPTNTNIYIHQPFHYKVSQKTTKHHYYAYDLVETTNYTYDNLTGNLKQQSYHDSRGEEYHINYYYPNDITNINSLENVPLTQAELQAYNLMKSPDATFPDNLNIISSPVQVEKVYGKTNEIISRQRITYQNIYSPGGNNNLFVLPHKIWEEKGTENDLEVKNVISVYDDWGNPVETYQPDGTYTYNVWGYNHSKLIAQIINLKAADVNGVIADLIQTAVDASDDDADSTSVIENNQNEKVLRQVLNDLQTSLPPETQMTYYTYDPLIGVTSITDPKGETRIYVYDNFSRLIKIMLDDGTTGPEGAPQNDNTILKEFEYHYKE